MLSDSDKEHIQNQVKELQSHLDSKHTKPIKAWITKFYNYVKGKKTKDQEILEQLTNNLGKKNNQKVSEIIFREASHYHLLDNLLNREKLKYLSDIDLKALYYLSIEKFNEGTRAERESVDRREAFEMGEEICTRKGIIKYLNQMLDNREKLGKRITDRDVLEEQLAKSEQRLAILEDLDKNSAKQFKKIRDKYSKLYTRYCTIPDIMEIVGQSSETLKIRLQKEGEILEKWSFAKVKQFAEKLRDSLPAQVELLSHKDTRKQEQLAVKKSLSEISVPDSSDKLGEVVK